MDIKNLSLAELQKALNSKELSALELVNYYIDRVEKYDATLNSFIHMEADAVRGAAKTQDEARAKGAAGACAGVPIGLKDNILTLDMPTTAASKILDGYYSPYEATVVKQLKSAGYIMMGKLNMDEFCMGASGETSYFDKTANPWDNTKTPGGSSSGPAAAMSARLVPATLASDTGGSIRQPAGYCGVTGYKPSYGVVSRYGVIGYASSLDQVGSITKSIEDAAFIVDSLLGKDPMDGTHTPKFSNLYKNLSTDIKGWKLGLPKAYITGDLAPAVKSAILDAVKIYESMGAEIVEIDTPHAEYGPSVYQTVASAEVSSNLARYDGIEFGYYEGKEDLDELYFANRSAFGALSKRRMLYGVYVLQGKRFEDIYVRALKVRQLIRDDYEKAYKKCDLIISPVSATTAFDLGGDIRTMAQLALNDMYTVNLNLSGGCGVSVPCGFDEFGLPIGLQLLGAMFDDQRLLNAAHAYQMATDWHKKLPLK